MSSFMLISIMLLCIILLGKETDLNLTRLLIYEKETSKDTVKKMKVSASLSAFSEAFLFTSNA